VERLGALESVGVTELLANVIGTDAEISRTRAFLADWLGSLPPLPPRDERTVFLVILTPSRDKMLP
jgi:hypothetical protein